MNNTWNSNYFQHKAKINRRRLWLIGCLLLVVVILSSVYFVTKTVTAQRNGERIKLVTSIEIQKGDTLWSIASYYISDEYDDIHEYVEELKDSNGLTSDLIHAGNYIIIPYYADASGY